MDAQAARDATDFVDTLRRMEAESHGVPYDRACGEAIDDQLRDVLDPHSGLQAA